MKNLIVLILFFVTVTVFAANTLFQVSTGNAMIAGLFQGTISFSELSKQGDFGLGFGKKHEWRNDSIEW